MAEILSEFVNDAIAKNRVSIPPQKVAQVRESVLEIFSEKGIASSAPIEELSERFKTIKSLKDRINAAVNSAREQLLY